VGRKPTRLLVSTAQRAELLKRLRGGLDSRSKERLQVVLWATEGPHTLDEISRRAGRARSTIQLWIDRFVAGGIAELLRRNTPPGATSPIGSTKIQTELRNGLKADRWPSAAAVAKWLHDTHGITRSRKSLYYWFNKLRGRRSVIVSRSKA